MGITHVRSDDIPTDRSAIEGDGFTTTFARFRTPPDREDRWHHHGEHHIVGYLISGRIRIELDDATAIEVAPGDIVHIEPGTVHRETYVGDIELVGFSAGTGPGRVDVGGPPA